MDIIMNVMPYKKFVLKAFLFFLFHKFLAFVKPFMLVFFQN